MNIYIPLGLILALLCFMFRRNDKNATNAFLFTMVLSCVFAMFRFEFGPDYFNYLEVYEGVQGADIENYTGRGMSIEPAFLYLIQVFPRFTFFVIALTLFWFIGNTLFLKKYAPSQFFWVIILYFFFKTDYFLDSLVAMRTTLCAAIFLIAVYFLVKGQRIIFAVLIILASMFHTSAIALLPIALITTNHKSLLFNDVVLWILGVIALISVLIGHNFMVESLSNVVMDSFDELQRYSERDVSLVGQSINTLIFRVMSFCILLYLANSGKKETEPSMVVFYKIAVIAAMINLIMGQSLINDRFFLILNPVYILAIVSSYKKNPASINVVITVFLFIIALYIFYNKFSKPYFVSFLHYHSIFSAPYIP